MQRVLHMQEINNLKRNVKLVLKSHDNILTLKVLNF